VGYFQAVNVLPGVGPDDPIAPDRLVWAIKFSLTFDICNPAGTCFSPRPGFSIAMLDFKTGEWLTTEGISGP
jgi:hypothetical protein